ncbi:unnamed protein product [Trypanosoma congolense IL3000]|uniref:WGS project CAEQ00000000 data, annotated contig 1924 n=1 Tax=Trypanosoma congolense (strain IL3000) TaxID=1068625 RepID=F9WA26_TRYCI|nr:unnamed protein product [Trypanosoma congolense IL3000]
MHGTFVRFCAATLLLLHSTALTACAASADNTTVEELNSEELEQLHKCRACVALTTIFSEEVVGPAEKVQQQLRQQQMHEKGSARSPRNSDAVRAGERQRLVADLHDAIEKLCTRVKEHNNRKSFSEEDKKQRQKSSAGAGVVNKNSGVGKKRLWYVPVTMAACDAVLEDVSESLATEAFALLLPERVSGSATGGLSTICEREHHCSARLTRRLAVEDEQAKAKEEAEEAARHRREEEEAKKKRQTAAQVERGELLRRATVVVTVVGVAALIWRGRKHPRPAQHAKEA